MSSWKGDLRDQLFHTRPCRPPSLVNPTVALAGVLGGGGDGAVLPGASTSRRAAPALARPHSRGPAALEQEPAPRFLRCVAGPCVCPTAHHVAFRAPPSAGSTWGSERVGMQGRAGPMCWSRGSFSAPPAPGRKALRKTACCFLPERAWAGAAAAPFLVPNCTQGLEGRVLGPGGAKGCWHTAHGEGSPFAPQPSRLLLLEPLSCISPQTSFRISLWRQGSTLSPLTPGPCHRLSPSWLPPVGAIAPNAYVLYYY